MSHWPASQWPTAHWPDSHWAGMAGTTDTTAPVIDSATIPAGGGRIVVAYLEADSPPILPQTSDVTGYSTTVNGVARSIVLGRATGQLEHTLFLDTPVYDTDVVRLMKTGGNVEDSNLTPNEMADIASPGILVTNNSTLSQSSGGGSGSPAVQYVIPVGGNFPPDTVPLTAGNTAGKLIYQMRDSATGALVPLSANATVYFILRKKGSATPELYALGEVENVAHSEVSFTFTPSVPVPADGRYDASFNVDGVDFPMLTHGTHLPVRIAEDLN